MYKLQFYQSFFTLLKFPYFLMYFTIFHKIFKHKKKREMDVIIKLFINNDKNSCFSVKKELIGTQCIYFELLHVSFFSNFQINRYNEIKKNIPIDYFLIYSTIHIKYLISKIWKGYSDIAFNNYCENRMPFWS